MFIEMSSDSQMLFAAVTHLVEWLIKHHQIFTTRENGLERL
jgi:hypothetical protein